MGKIITRLMIETAYEYSRKFYHNEIDLGSGLNSISLLSGMHRGTALSHISVFCSMMKGEGYRSKITADATKYYLLNIHNDYGEEYFNLALAAVKLHIKKYKEEKNKNLIRLMVIVDEFEKDILVTKV
ncbi:hypothetical protein ACYCSU_16835 [Paenibacillus sp. ALE1]